MTLCLKPGQIEHGDDLLLTTTQINRLQKAAGVGKGADLKISQTQMEKMAAQRGGNLFSTVLGLARPLLVPMAKALGMARKKF